jgi:hypothetical protein
LQLPSSEITLSILPSPYQVAKTRSIGHADIVVWGALYILKMPQAHFLKDFMVLAKLGADPDYITAARFKLAAQLQVDVGLILELLLNRHGRASTSVETSSRRTCGIPWPVSK